MSNSAVAWINYVNTGTLAAGSSAANLGVSNLQDDRGSPSTAWQTAAGVVTAAGGATLTVTTPGGVISPFNVCGLFRLNLTPAASVTAVVKLGGSPAWTSSALHPVAGYGQVVFVMPATQNGDSVVFSIDDSTNPDGFINVPLAIAGPAWFPIGSASWQSTFGRDSQVDEVVSKGGQEYPTMRWQRRRWNVALDSVRGSELYADIGELDRVSRAGGNVLFIPDVNSVALQQEAIFGRLQATADVSFPYQFADRRAWRATLTERI